jgi:hypothetical protein
MSSKLVRRQLREVLSSDGADSKPTKKKLQSSQKMAFPELVLRRKTESKDEKVKRRVEALLKVKQTALSKRKNKDAGSHTENVWKAVCQGKK